MTVLWVLLIIVAVFWLLGRVRLGSRVRYDEDGLLVKVLAGPVKITVIPKKKLSEAEREKREAKAKAKKEKKEERKKAKQARKEEKRRKKHPDEEPEEKKGGALPPILDLLPLVGEAAGGLKRRIRIDELTIYLTWASDDPAQTAAGYGWANAAMGMIWPLLDHNFNIKKHDLGIGVDFTETKPAIRCQAALTMRLGQLVGFTLRLGIKFLSIMIRSRSRKSGRMKKQEA